MEGLTAFTDSTPPPTFSVALIERKPEIVLPAFVLILLLVFGAVVVWKTERRYR